MWHWASLFFQSVHNDHPTASDYWEQQVIILQADSDEDAKVIAERIGKEKEHEYISMTGDRVKWVFRHVESISELFDQSLKPGSEVYSRFLRADEVRSLLQPIEERDRTFKTKGNKQEME
jgi:hypothetical protein